MKFTESLRKNHEFQYVYKNGSSCVNKYLVMYCMNNQTEKNRLGISVSKKVGNSVVRHHVKRLIKESYRLNENSIDTGLDIVIISRASAKDCTYAQIESAVLHLLRKSGIYGKEDADHVDQVLSEICVPQQGNDQM